MKVFIRILIASLTICSCVPKSRVCTISNGAMSLTFSELDGRLIGMKDISTGEEMIDSNCVAGLPWHFLCGREVSGGDAHLESIVRRSRRKAAFRWNTTDGISVNVTVTLGFRKPFSYWTAEIRGLENRRIEKFVFPCISGLKPKADEKIAYGEWTGHLWTDLRAALGPDNPSKRYASKMGMMQLAAIYGGDAPGLYASCDDVDGYLKRAVVVVDTLSTCYMMENLLPAGADEYEIPYASVIGSFEGDWMDAAQIYRQWGTRQEWCRDSRMRGSLTDSWAADTDIWVWNRGESDNVLAEAVDLQDFLGDSIRVSVLWHWWHHCLYDDTFPEYLPPREGTDKFRDAVRKAKERGINALVYMNSYQWGSSAESWTREGAEPYKALSYDGGDYSKVYNVFTGHSLTPMCLATEFWRDKYASIAAEAVNDLGVSGIYMDQLCNSFACWNPAHGHGAGGGNYWIEGASELIDEIRGRTVGGNVVIGGEGHSEKLFPKMDLALTLQASWERYKYTPNLTIIPLFEAVYHDYAATFGSYTSLTYPPYDGKWPAELRPDDCEKLLPDEFNTQFRLELAKTFVWGIQPMIANYHPFLRESRPQEMEFLRRLVLTRSRAHEYLCRGEMLRSPDIRSDTLEIDNSKISLYAGRAGDMLTQRKLKVPALQFGTWRSPEGGVAIAVSNISESDQPLEFSFDAGGYGLRDHYEVAVIDCTGRRVLMDCRSGKANVAVNVCGLDTVILEFKQL